MTQLFPYALLSALSVSFLSLGFVVSISHFWRKLRPSSVAIQQRTISSVVGGTVWHFTEAGTHFFGSQQPNWDEWLKLPNTAIVKDGLQRTIARVVLPGGTVFVKRIRANTPRAWLREIFRPSKGRLEFQNALLLQQQGIACVEPLAFGEHNSRWPGDSFVITRALEYVVPGDVFLEKHLSEQHALRRGVAVELAKFFAKMHDSGVAHPDPHPGNFLVERTNTNELKFTLLDVHDVRFGSPLTWPESRENLVLFNRWFQMRATRSDRLRFWRAYFRSRSSLGKFAKADAARMAKEVELETDKSNRRFWAGRTSRYKSNNRQFLVLHTLGGRDSYAVRDCGEGRIPQIVDLPQRILTGPNSKLLKDSRTSTVAEAETEFGTLVAKRYRVKQSYAPIKNLFRASPALRSWLNGHALLDRGIATPRPIFFTENQFLSLPTDGYVVFEKVPNALDLADASARQADHRIRRNWIALVGELIRLMHDRDVAHADLKAPNILMQDAATDPTQAVPVLVDLVGVRTGCTVKRNERIRNIARLNASFVNSPIVTRTDRLRFLRSYLWWNMRGRGDWKSWWRSIAVATQAKVEKNQRSGRPLA